MCRRTKLLITKRSTIAVLVAACVWGGASITPIAFIVLNHGCDADDDRLVTSLGILDVRPASATLQEGRSSSCENDDRITTVRQTYRPSGREPTCCPPTLRASTADYRDVGLTTTVTTTSATASTRPQPYTAF
ncbi:hypothetical protein ACTWPT_59480 [Nonomuraea sp. 3N208]|uniref:hypothetical protein n=1 Tax=Nonomuraea sp. 3N208 TaxID=3457421 RepID=UPI003FD2F38F